MFRNWLRFVQPLAVGFVVLAVAMRVSGQETPAAPAEAAEPAATAEATPPPAAEETEPAAEAPATEAAPPAEAAPEAEMTPPTEAAPAPEAPAPEAAAPGDPQSDAGDPAAVFAEKLAAWKEALGTLRRLRIDYRTATAEQAPQVLASWNETVARTEALLEELREAGQAAFVAAPNANAEMTEFLIKLVADDVARDNYESALDTAKALLDNGCENKALFDPAAVAAFAAGDFEAADAWSRRAQDAGTLGETASKNLTSIPSYKKYWQEEQQIRQREAEQDDLPRIRLTTSKGEMVVELFENEAPGAVGNFVALVEQKFYDGLTFHRVLSGFMAQGGCPRGDGMGGPGYTIYCECQQPNYRKHFRGTLSMAHAGRNTGGSQFFITFVPTPHLNGQHTAFGRVIEGLEVLAKLQRIDPEGSGAPIPDKIITAEVIRKRDHEYQPRKVEAKP